MNNTDLVARALKIAKARDAFLTVKAAFNEAEKEYFAHCEVVTFEFEGADHAKFCFVRDDYNQVEWRYTPEHVKTHPARPPIALNEDFIEWQAAYKAKGLAKAKQNRAMRKLQLCLWCTATRQAPDNLPVIKPWSELL